MTDIAEMVKRLRRRTYSREAAEIAALLEAEHARAEAMQASFVDEVEAAAKIAEGTVVSERYRTWPWWGDGNRANESDIVQHADRIAAAIRAHAHNPQVSGRRTHRHKKRGTEYVLIGYGRMQAEDWVAIDPDWVDGPKPTVDMREVAIYRSTTDPNEIWVRPREEFEDGRFEGMVEYPFRTKPSDAAEDGDDPPNRIPDGSLTAPEMMATIKRSSKGLLEVVPSQSSEPPPVSPTDPPRPVAAIHETPVVGAAIHETPEATAPIPDVPVVAWRYWKPGIPNGYWEFAGAPMVPNSDPLVRRVDHLAVVEKLTRERDEARAREKVLGDKYNEWFERCLVAEAKVKKLRVALSEEDHGDAR